MQFIKTSEAKPIVEYIASALENHLAKNELVLCLLAGGSFIPVEVEILARLRANPNLANLTLTLTDERFGEVGHPDSNWRQLSEAGLKLDGAVLLPILSGKDLAATRQDFESSLGAALDKADYVLVLAGIGADGHTLGVKPNSPAVGSERLVEAYDWDDYKRITATAQLMEKASEVVVYAMGKEKEAALQKLKTTVPVKEQPAQLLKSAPQLTIFSDQAKEEE